MSASFTIAVPFHSGLEYLRLALESVRAQDDPDWELLIVDDSGDSDAGAELERLVEGLADTRIRVLVNAGNLGMVPCWNRCLDEARGELVTLLHADDLLRPDYVRSVRLLAAEHPQAVALFTGSDIIDAAGQPQRSLQDDIKHVFEPRGSGAIVLNGESGLRAIMRGNFIVCPTLAWRKSVLGERRFDPTWRQVQDLDLTARLLLAGETLVGTRRRVYAYRRHDENATARQSASLLRFREEYRLFDRIAQLAEQRGWSRAASTSRRKTIVRLHLGWRTLRALAAGEVRAAARTLAFLAGVEQPGEEGGAQQAGGFQGLTGATGGALLATLVGLGLMFLTTLLLSRALGTVDFGALVYMLAWSEILALIAPLGFDKLLIRELAAFRGAQRLAAARGLLRCAGLFGTLGAGAAILVALGFLALLGDTLDEPTRSVFALTALLVPLRAWGNLRHGALLGLSRPIQGMLATSVTSHLVLLPTIAGLWLFAPELLTLRSAAWAAVGAWAVAALVAEIGTRRDALHPRLAGVASEAQPRAWLAAALPMLLIVAMAVITLRADTLMLGAMRGAAEVGIYEIAARFALLVRLGLVAVNPVLAPMAVGARGADELGRVARRATRLAFLPAALIAFVLLISGFWALRLFGPDFDTGYLPMGTLALGFLVVTAMGPVETILLMKNQQRFAAAAAAGACVLNLVLNATLIPVLGMQGAALATALSLIAWGLAMSAAVKRRLGLRMDLLARDPS